MFAGIIFTVSSGLVHYLASCHVCGYLFWRFKGGPENHQLNTLQTLMNLQYHTSSTIYFVWTLGPYKIKSLNKHDNTIIYFLLHF